MARGPRSRCLSPPGHGAWGAGAGWQGQSLGLCWFLGHSSFSSPPLSREGLSPSFIPRQFWFLHLCFCPGSGITSRRAGTKDDFRSTFILRGFFPSRWLFFILHFSHPGLFFPTSSPSRVTGIPSLSEGSWGGLAPYPVLSHGRWEWGGITPRIFKTCVFLGGKPRGWAGLLGWQLLCLLLNWDQGLGSHSS